MRRAMITSHSRMTRDDLRALVESNKDKIYGSEWGSFCRDEALEALLGINVSGSEVEGRYEGQQADLFVFDCGSVLIVCSYFGSCSYCDLWESIDNAADAYDAARTEIFNGLLFADFHDAYQYLTNIDDSNRPPDVLRVVSRFIPYIERRIRHEEQG